MDLPVDFNNSSTFIVTTIGASWDVANILEVSGSVSIYSILAGGGRG